MLEVNPLAEDENGHLLAADAKLNFDDNAQFRQKELFALRDTSQEVRVPLPGLGLGFGLGLGLGVGLRLGLGLGLGLCIYPSLCI